MSTYERWSAIDWAELAGGAREGRKRAKISHRQELLRIARRANGNDPTMTENSQDPPPDLETAGLRPESAGGAGMTEEGAPAGFTAEVGGSPPGVTDNADELQDFVPDASQRGPVQESARRDAGEPEDDVPWVG